MLKIDEANNDDSCFNRAKDDEHIFVLLARDSAAPATVRFWANERIRIGKNQFHDRQIQEAFECARLMEIAREAQ